MTRRIVEIACAATTVDGYLETVVVALCDDGTLWTHDSTDARGWNAMPPVPQPPQELRVAQAPPPFQALADAARNN